MSKNNKSSKKVVKNKTVKKRKLRRSSVTLLIGIFLLLIPALVFGGIILTAYVTNFKPVIGSRFAGDLNPKITNDNLKDIENKLKALTNIDDYEVNLTTSQLRVVVDMKDDLNEEDANALAEEIYGIVNEVTNIYTYFTATEDKKMYDLAIDIFNHLDNSKEDYIHLNLTKNSKMNEYYTQLISSPKDEELAKELRGEIIHEETPGGENINVDPDAVDQGDTEE